MKSKDLDIEYLEFMLDKVFKIVFTYKKIGTIYYGELQYVFSDFSMGKSALYYLLYRLQNDTISITMELNKKNLLNVTLDVWNKKIKIITEEKVCNWVELSAMIDTYDFPIAGADDKDVIVIISCHFQETTESKQIFIYDDDILGSPAGAIRGYLQKYNNAGFQLFPP